MKYRFTPKAKKVWESIHTDLQKQVLKTVWCGHCGKTSSIHNFSGKTESGLLVLRGSCTECGEDVVRVIGTKKLRSLFYKYLAKKKMEEILKEINLKPG
ncbi:hypothetical protein ACFL03_08500 [Thermodesulfobacteriota bacterium]